MELLSRSVLPISEGKEGRLGGAKKSTGCREEQESAGDSSLAEDTASEANVPMLDPAPVGHVSCGALPLCVRAKVKSASIFQGN